MNQNRDANSRAAGYVAKTALMSFIIIVEGFVIFYFSEKTGNNLLFRVPATVVALFIIPTLVCVICFFRKEKNIWFYPLSHVVVFIICTVLLYFFSGSGDGRGFITITFFIFSRDFPKLFRSSVIYGIPAVIAGVVYSCIIKVKAVRGERK